MIRNSLISKILVISFTIVAVFGFWLMTHDQMMGHGSCVANTIQGFLCAQVNPFAFAGFHVSAFNSFVSVAMQSALDGSVLAVFALIAAMAVIFLGITGSPPVFGLVRLPDHKNGPEFIHKIRFASWYSLLENSPSLV